MISFTPQHVKLTPSDIELLASQYRDMRQWQAVVEFALRFFGPLSHTVEVVTAQEYDSYNNSYYMEIYSFTVKDVNGRELEKSPETDYLKQHLIDVGVDLSDEAAVDQEIDEVYYNELGSLDALDFVCEVGKPPQISYAEVYAVVL